MTTQTWPGELPQCPPVDRRQYQPEGNIVAFKPDVGPVLLYPRATAAGAQAQFTFVVTRAQLQIFDSWFRNELLGGANSFRLRDPVLNDAAAEWQMEGPPIYAPLTSNMHELTLQLYRLP